MGAPVISDGYIDMAFYQEMIKKYKKKTHKVIFILEHFPEARNNDNYLIYLYWRLVDKITHIQDIIHATSAESIRRIRQRLNENKMYLPTEEKIIEQRKRRS